VKEKAGLRPLTAREAKRAVFIDFEGTRKDAPSLLGVYVAGRKSFSQTVFEQALYPAVSYKSPKITWRVKAADPVEALAKLRRTVESRRLRVFAWSPLEQRLILKLSEGFPELREFWKGRVENAIPYAKAWQRQAHPDKKLPKKKGRGRNTLDNYRKLVGFEQHSMYGARLVGKRIRGARAGLAAWGRLKTGTQKGYWTNLLIHNRDDCQGMASVMAVVAGARKRQSKKNA
jgi:hypothetical protein